ncbi:NAD(P)-binding protein [Hypoxylon sp. FL1284]|nr:NAD(P)-binding protein [Hypoxylon sp. FL1284]
MANIAKTVVATGASSGLGFELVKQLLARTQPHKFILGARDIKTTQAAFDNLKYDSSTHSLTIFPLELSNLRNVKTFSQQALSTVGQGNIDYLLLNAAISMSAEKPGPHGSKWSLLEEDVKGSSTSERGTYSATKFIHLLGAHWWRRQLQGTCRVVAVSPGLIPGTGLPRGTKLSSLPVDHPDAKSIPEGAQSIFRAFTREDFPEDPEQIFLTSWGEWWPKDVYQLSLDESLQDKWCPSKDQIEKEEGLAA